jgi:hypothetical protein
VWCEVDMLSLRIMSRGAGIAWVWLSWLSAATLTAQTLVSLSSIIPGSERVQLVYNGDFQTQGPPVSGAYPYPVGWTRAADMFCGAGLNAQAVDGGVVARAHVDGGAAVGMYSRTVQLLPNTDYVLSAYLWNMGDAANHVTAVVDFADAPQEPQLALYWSNASADQGYFVYRTFNTADTGSTVLLRVFYDGLAGNGAAAAYYPLAAQWDNIAITRASDFAPPQAAGSGANRRPVVCLTQPTDGTNLVLSAASAALTLAASASDLDGHVTKVEFYAGAARIGEASMSPFAMVWSNVVSDSYQVTAEATDDGGATTVSAPVSLAVLVMPSPVTLSLRAAATNLAVSWSTSATTLTLQASTNPLPAAVWKMGLPAPTVTNGQNQLGVSKSGLQQFYRLGPEVDASTLNRKLLMGYQGWFGCPNDGSPPNRWVHWFRNNTPTAANVTVDFWPDVSELGPEELFATSMTLSNGSAARVYSAYTQKTVSRHFKWMKDNHLDGVFLQRFSSELSDPAFFTLRNQVATNVRRGADTYGRVFAIMYDISGQPAATLLNTLTNDWAFLAGYLQLTNSPRYLRHKGRPVVAIWGFGFTDRPGTPQDALAVAAFFKAAGCTVMGGVPTYWRTLNNDSQADPAWANAYLAFDVISPWSVGRYGTTNEADNFKANLIQPDLAYCTAHNVEYMPVIFPGFSWHNLNAGPLNQIPRLSGAFYWRQAYNAVSAGCRMIYGAMFDEMDEGTAMFKLAPTPNELPAPGTFVPLNIDGQALPSDWYLRLADQAGQMLRGEIPLQPGMPIRP